MKIILPFFLLLFLYNIQTIYSQNNISADTTNGKGITSQIITDPFLNPVILKHYSVADLQYFKDNDPDKFKTIVYYYTESFIIKKYACTDCVSFNIQEFDVSNFEKFRLKNKRFVRDYDKYGGILTLLSIDELTYKLPIHTQ